MSRHHHMRPDRTAGFAEMRHWRYSVCQSLRLSSLVLLALGVAGSAWVTFHLLGV